MSRIRHSKGCMGLLLVIFLDDRLDQAVYENWIGLDMSNEVG